MRAPPSPKVFTPEYYQRLHEVEEAHGWVRGMRAIAGALLDPIFQRRTGMWILDAGCGTGGTLDWLRRFPASHIVGVDLSSHALAFCRRRGHAALVEGSVAAMPFEARTFDLVLCIDVLQHVPDPPGDDAVLRELFRVLRPGGRLFVRTNAHVGPEPARYGPDYRRYRRTGLAARAAGAGFVLERATHVNSLPSLCAAAKTRIQLLGSRARPDARHHDPGLGVSARRPGLRWVDAVLYCWLAIEAWVLRYLGGRLPFGQSLVLLARKPDPMAA